MVLVLEAIELLPELVLPLDLTLVRLDELVYLLAHPAVVPIIIVNDALELAH